MFPEANKETEVKILGINKEEILHKLTVLGAKYIGESLQEIYTYDFFSIYSTFVGLVDVLDREVGEKEKLVALKKLKNLFSDLNDLVNESQKKDLERIIGDNSIDEFLSGKNFNLKELIDKLNDEELINIISKFDTHPHKWVRLRRSGKKVTLSSKHIFNRKKKEDNLFHHSINDVKEIEIEINDFLKGKELLESLGYFHKNYQEKKRISYIFENNIHIDIDKWPLVPSYLEIESNSETKILRMVKLLGFSENDIKIINSEDVFTYYGLNMYDYKELKFE